MAMSRAAELVAEAAAHREAITASREQHEESVQGFASSIKSSINSFYVPHAVVVDSAQHAMAGMSHEVDREQIKVMDSELREHHLSAPCLCVTCLRATRQPKTTFCSFAVLTCPLALPR